MKDQEYRESIDRFVDAQLRAMPLPEPTEQFLASLAAIEEQGGAEPARAPQTDLPAPDSAMLPSFLRDLAPAVVVLVPCTVLWIAAGSLSIQVQAALQVLFTAGGIAAVLATFLRPRMLSHW